MTQTLEKSSNTALVPRSITADKTAVHETAQAMLANAKQGGRDGLFEQSMTEAQAYQIARLAVGYGLDPFARHIVLYQGAPYVTKKGAFANASEHPQYDGLEYAPASPDERKLWQVGDGDTLVIARVWRKDRRLPFTGVGIVSPSGADSNQPVAKKHPQLMAIARACRRALMDAFSLPIPFARPEFDPTIDDDEGGGYPVAGVIDAESRVVDQDDEADASNPYAAIHAVAKELGWIGLENDERYRTFLHGTFGTYSSKDLTDGQRAAVVEAMRAYLARRQAQEKADALRAITKAQRERITALCAELELEADDFHRILRTVSVAATQLITLSERQGKALIQALENEAAKRQETGVAADVVDAEPTAPPPPPTEEEKQRYGVLMANLMQLGGDPVDFETDASTDGPTLEAINARLEAAIARLKEQSAGQQEMAL